LLRIDICAEASYPIVITSPDSRPSIPPHDKRKAGNSGECVLPSAGRRFYESHRPLIIATGPSWISPPLPPLQWLPPRYLLSLISPSSSRSSARKPRQAGRHIMRRVLSLITSPHRTSGTSVVAKHTLCHSFLCFVLLPTSFTNSVFRQRTRHAGRAAEA
jgi:hypothetical protein